MAALSTKLVLFKCQMLGTKSRLLAVLCNHEGCQSAPMDTWVNKKQKKKERKKERKKELQFPRVELST